MVEHEFLRVQLAGGLVRDNITAILGEGIKKIELVSVGVNDVYRIDDTHFVKFYNPTFVDYIAQAKLHEFMRLRDPQSLLVVLPEKGAGLRFIIAHGLRCAYSVFPAVKGKPLGSGDFKKAVSTGLHLRSLLNGPTAQATTLPTYVLEVALDELVSTLEPWSDGASSGTISRLLNAVKSLRKFSLPPVEVQCEVQHGDFHYNNIFWTDDGPKVIDYDFARFAPTGYDLATILWMEQRRNGRKASTQKYFVSVFRDQFKCCALSDDLMIGRYVDYLIILRHVFFLTVQARLWTFRGSEYIRDRRTTDIIDFLELLISKPSPGGRG